MKSQPLTSVPPFSTLFQNIHHSLQFFPQSSLPALSFTKLSSWLRIPNQLLSFHSDLKLVSSSSIRLHLRAPKRPNPSLFLLSDCIALTPLLYFLSDLTAPLPRFNLRPPLLQASGTSLDLRPRLALPYLWRGKTLNLYFLDLI